MNLQEHPSARQFLDSIRSGHSPSVEPDLLDVLAWRYDAARRYQINEGVDFQLTFAEFIALITPSRMNTIRKAIKKGTVDSFFRSKSRYVLSWKSSEAFETRMMNFANAAFINAEDSKRVNQFKAGDTHSEESKAKIRAKKLGTTHSDETKAKMAEAKRGTTHSDETRQKMAEAKRGRKMSEETKAKIRAAMLARREAQ